MAVGISGSPSRDSRSRVLLEQALLSLRQRGMSSRLIDLSALPAEGLLARAPSPEVERAVAEVAAARVVVVSTPVYKAAYSGLLKVFCDLLPPNALAGAVGVPIAVGALPVHLPLVDLSLRALLGSLGARVVPTGTYATETQVQRGREDPALTGRIELAAGEALLLAGMPGAPPP